MTIENKFNIAFISAHALKEKQIQQNYRPIIAVHKWFARRPGTLFRGLILSEFGDAPVEETFYRRNSFPDRRIADPFMGGGTPLIEANRVGCDVDGFDINPMATWIVREEIEHLDLSAYGTAAGKLLDSLRKDIGSLYLTDCPLYGDSDVPVKYFLWVKQIDCEQCGSSVDLFPGHLLSEDTRHPLNVFVCPSCGDLNETPDRDEPGTCRSCSADLREDGPARRGRCPCSHCGHLNSYPRPASGPLRHRMFAIEYYNPGRKAGHKGRFFKKPDEKDLARYESAESRWRNFASEFVPLQPILSGDETDRLHRWGYSHYRDLFNSRQLLGLELSCSLIAAIRDQRVRHALATNLSDLLRYQNMLCRYDTMALKSLDIFSIHGFPVGLIQCESNLLGITNGGATNVGSGGWSNIVDKYAKAKKYCDAPFEVRHQGARKEIVSVPGEWIGERMPGKRPRTVNIHCTSATTVALPENSLDAVFTDPPYFGNVQYGELMDFCYVWLRRLVGNDAEGFDRASTRDAGELTGNVTKARGLDHFTEGLAAVYRNMARALKPGRPLVFTYHHNKIEAYHAIGVAILDAGLTCSASFPCPAEMGGSIHIHGTASSIVDTVFVCRMAGATQRKWLAETPAELLEVVADDLDQLRLGGLRPTLGDVRCIIFGHATRMAIWKLRGGWSADGSTSEKINCVAEAVSAFGDLEKLSALAQARAPQSLSSGPLFSANEQKQRLRDAVSF